MRHMRRMLVRGRLFLVASSAILLAGVLPVGGVRTQEPHAPSVSAGAVERVTAVRRILRSACGRLQNALASEEGRAEWLAQAAAEVEEGRKLWATLRSEFPEAGPGPYASLPDWPERAGEIADGIQDMLAKTRTGEAAPARTACGQNCGRFTALNEGARLELAPDALFRFRQAARPLAELMGKGDWEGVSDALPQLLALRTRGLQWTSVSPVAAGERAAALEAFSASVDGFAEALRARKDAEGAYAEMMKALESAYDAVL